jgi:hypothetical protein
MLNFLCIFGAVFAIELLRRFVFSTNQLMQKPEEDEDEDTQMNYTPE